mgnify:CR=1 FL=1
MSTLETNSIAKYSGNNVSIDDSLNLKSYTTTQRDALTSAAGDMIYNSTTSKVQYFDGSSWVDTGSSFFNIEYLAVAGGGSGGVDGCAQPAGGAGCCDVSSGYPDQRTDIEFSAEAAGDAAYHHGRRAVDSG